MTTFARGELPQYRIADHYGALIASGVLPVGAQLPTGQEIARELGVPRRAVLLGMQLLELRELVEVRPGEGTFVAVGGRVAWKAIADRLAYQLHRHARCGEHREDEADPDCGACEDRKAMAAYQRALSGSG